ncbi:MAG TPA: DUF4388 domain-containing protein [Polyangia bacterium]|jgi:hypothetical protein|nr:DUF4388 domain-containing protein [Polyangia bacterium]
MHGDSSTTGSSEDLGTNGDSAERPVLEGGSEGVPEATDEGSESEQIGFSGSCQTTLIDWIQLVQMGRRDAVIHVHAHDGKEGSLWCRGGDIIDAAGDGVVGETAVFRILSWTGGSVTVEFGATDRSCQIQTPTTGLLLRAAYRRDSGVHEIVTQPSGGQSAPALRTFDSTDEVTEVSDQSAPFRYHQQPQELQPRPRPRETSPERRRFSLGFAISGGLSVLLLFSVLASLWTYVTRARVGTPPPPPERAAARDDAPTRGALLRATWDSNPAAPPSPSSQPAAPARLPRADSPLLPKASAGLARRRAAMALARPSAAPRPSTLTPREFEEFKASASSNMKAAATSEGRPRIQIIEEPAAREQPRVRIIDERQPHIEAVE